MNQVKLSGVLISRVESMQNAYEGIFQYSKSRIKSGNLIKVTKQVGIYISFDLLGEVPVTNLFNRTLLIEGSLINSELDNKTRTTSIVVTSFEFLDQDPEINEVEISGEISGLKETKSGVNYTLRNNKDPLMTRVFSFTDQFSYKDGDKVKVKGSMRSYDYSSKISGKVYNINGVKELSIESCESE